MYPELTHYGVKGMKWGVRKKRESDSVRKARKNLDSAKDDLKKANTNLNRSSMYGVKMPDKKYVDDLQRANREYRFAKEDLASAKILDKVNSKPKSPAQLKMEEKYKSKGYSNDEAAVAAYSNLRTKKVLMGVGAVAATGAAVVASKYISENYVDKVIKAGKKVQHISTDSSMGVRDAFYSSHNYLDKVKYRGIFGTQLSKTGATVYNKEVTIVSDIRRASRKTVMDTINELAKQDEIFRYSMGGWMSSKTGKMTKQGYDAFNKSLVYHDKHSQTRNDKVYEALRKKGFNAIVDVNDRKFSGYKASNPIITFGSEGKVKVTNVKELTQKQIDKDNKLGYAAIFSGEIAKTGAMWAASYFGTKALTDTVNRKVTDSNVKKYMREHPDTKLSYKEIARKIERGEISV